MAKSSRSPTKTKSPKKASHNVNKKLGGQQVNEMIRQLKEADKAAKKALNEATKNDPAVVFN